MMGKIHSIETFSTVDGPGIRMVVFMQGCNLRCKFCHNIDTWNTEDGEFISSNKLVEKILRGINYYNASNGGVTFSGGEPFLQAEFLLEVCKGLKEKNIHIAIDTAGNFDKNNKQINELLQYVDLFLYDIKHIDDEEHKKLVGVSNSKILEFCSYLSNEKNKKMWIRIVYIPGITDRKKDYLEMYKKYISTLKSVEKIDVLPYHEMGKYKWNKMGIKYQLENVRIPSTKECKEIEKYLSK